jgi:hypothetical protein
VVKGSSAPSLSTSGCHRNVTSLTTSSSHALFLVHDIEWSSKTSGRILIVSFVEAFTRVSLLLVVAMRMATCCGCNEGIVLRTSIERIQLDCRLANVVKFIVDGFYSQYMERSHRVHMKQDMQSVGGSIVDIRYYVYGICCA